MCGEVLQKPGAREKPFKPGAILEGFLEEREFIWPDTGSRQRKQCRGILILKGRKWRSWWGRSSPASPEAAVKSLLWKEGAGGGDMREGLKTAALFYRSEEGLESHLRNVAFGLPTGSF